MAGTISTLDALTNEALRVAPTASSKPLSGSFPIVELRQYTLHDGMRDRLIDLFEREFIESQEALGMEVIGTFRDIDSPNRFVWLRGFHDMDSRLRGLTDFYGGAVWSAHRERANSTMIDSDNVLLLHAGMPGAEFHGGSPRPDHGESAPAGIVVATIHYLKPDANDAAEVFAQDVEPALKRAGVELLAWFVSESAPNNYPRLPVREGEKVLVWFAGFSTTADHELREAGIGDALAPLSEMLSRQSEVLRLKPTGRSQLRGLTPHGTVQDFNFLIGNWSVKHRRLRTRGVGSSDWENYSGTAETRALLGGLCNVEEHRIDGSTASGVAVRCFDKATRRWAIYWISERDGTLQPPIYGGFRGDEGVFEGVDTDCGKLVQVRFDWRRLGPNSAKWEQAFSYDQGRTWETNWIMQFERSKSA
jgi:hypothetical protein